MRIAEIKRNTLETQITAAINLDGTGMSKLDSGLGFLDHMLDQIARHGMMDISIAAQGDLHIDAHHTVEDIGITLGQAFAQAIGDKKGVRRYGHAYVPLDEALSRVVLDLSGRPLLVFEGQFLRERVGDLPTELVPHFFQSLCDAAGMTLHLRVRGDNAHHMVEACFKAVARALRQACAREGAVLPSSKGLL